MLIRIRAPLVIQARTFAKHLPVGAIYPAHVWLAGRPLVAHLAPSHYEVVGPEPQADVCSADDAEE